MFSARRCYAILVARNKEFYRDIGALGWTFLFPILVVVAFAYVFELDDDGLYKGAYVGKQAPTISLISWVSYPSAEQAKDQLKHHRVHIVVDNGTETYWTNQGSPQSQVAERILIAEQASSTYQRQTISTREIEYVDWLFPGLITMNVMWLALWGVGWVIVRQRKIGVLKRFKASPLTALEYLIAQMLSRLTILLGTGIVVFVGAHLIHPFRTVGSYLDLLIVYTLGCLALGSMGLVIASRLTSDEFASGLINLLSMPMMFLSEIWFSLEGSEEWVKWLAKCMPLWHMTDAMRRIMTEGASLWDVRSSVMVLILISVVVTTIGAKSFKWTSV